MPNTVPEGFTPPPESSPIVGSRSFLIVVSTILGIILSTGAVIGFFGRAFYVERGEYNAKNLQDAQDKVSFTAGIQGINARLDRQDVAINRMEVNIDKLVNSVQDIKVEQARRRGR